MLLALVLAARAAGQCPGIEPGFHRPGGAGLDDFARVLQVHDDGGGRRLYMAGAQLAGSIRVRGVARWTGGDWENLGEGLLGEIRCLQSFEVGGAPRLVAGGRFQLATDGPFHVLAAWDGTSWSPIAQPGDGSVAALCVFDPGAGPELVATGSFLTIDGVPAQGLARWNGSTWAAIPDVAGAGIGALTVFDDGVATRLIAAGGYLDIPGLPSATTIAAWNGSAWSGLAGGVDGMVTSLATYDDGAGPALHVGGLFEYAGGTLRTGSSARWDGTSWSALGRGTFERIEAMEVFDDGGGPALYAAGRFEVRGHPHLRHLLRWDGRTWSAVVPEAAHLSVLRGLDDGSGTRRLFASGADVPVPGDASRGIASFVGCGPGSAGTPICAGDGSASACPCGNSGAASHGCGNSFVAEGARLRARGTASLASDTVVLEAEHLPPTATALFCQSIGVVDGGTGRVFGDGILCVAGTKVRLGVRTSVGGASELSSPGGVPISRFAGIAQPGVRHYQVWYRNVAPFCTPAGFNQSNGLRISWGP
jgi:hypothetical protein